MVYVQDYALIGDGKEQGSKIIHTGGYWLILLFLRNNLVDNLSVYVYD